MLLIHGLTGTPTEMRFVGNGLNRAGFTVLGMQLAGHCGDEADLLATGWRDWYASVVAAAARLREEVDHLFVAGLSMGAVLALKLAIDRPRDVDGIGLYGTTFFHDGWATPAIGRLAFLLPLGVRLGIGRRQISMESPPYGIKDERISKRIVDAMLSGDSAGRRSRRISVAVARRVPEPLAARAQPHRPRARAVHRSCIPPTTTSRACSNVRIVERGVRAPVETVLLDDSYHMVTVDRQRGELIERSTGFFRRIAEAKPVRVSEPAIAAAID